MLRQDPQVHSLVERQVERVGRRPAAMEGIGGGAAPAMRALARRAVAATGLHLARAQHPERAALDDLGKVLLAGAQFGIVADALALIVDALLQGSGDLRQLSLPGVADIEHLQVIDAGAQKPDGGIDRCACAERYRRRQGGCRDEPRMRLQQALIVFIAQDEQFDFA